MAEIAGIAASIIEKIMMAGRTLHGAVIMMIECDREQRPLHDQPGAKVHKTRSHGEQYADYKQGSTRHGDASEREFGSRRDQA